MDEIETYQEIGRKLWRQRMLDKYGTEEGIALEMSRRQSLRKSNIGGGFRSKATQVKAAKIRRQNATSDRPTSSNAE